LNACGLLVILSYHCKRKYRLYSLIIKINGKKNQTHAA
jgi:hypothetical protein